MTKHVYLIKAHHQFKLLEKLIKLLDHPRNDIFIHISKNTDFDRSRLEKCVAFSKLYFIAPVKEQWGGYSQIQSELALLRAAVPGRYIYYHLLSGADLPIKCQQEIHQFFEENNGKEFLQFSGESFCRKSGHKYKYYRLFQEKIGRKQKGIYYTIEKLSLFLQRKSGVDRTEKNTIYQCGANWFSITHDLAQYILKNEKKIYKMFHATLCCDQFFIQTLVWNSRFRNNVFSIKDDVFSCLRLIDWKRGNPYVWRKCDYFELINAPHLFARKFDEEADAEIIEMIYNHIIDKQKKQ